MSEIIIGLVAFSAQFAATYVGWSVTKRPILPGEKRRTLVCEVIVWTSFIVGAFAILALGLRAKGQPLTRADLENVLKQEHGETVPSNQKQDKSPVTKEDIQTLLKNMRPKVQPEPPPISNESMRAVARSIAMRFRKAHEKFTFDDIHLDNMRDTAAPNEKQRWQQETADLRSKYAKQTDGLYTEGVNIRDAMLKRLGRNVDSLNPPWVSESIVRVSPRNAEALEKLAADLPQE